MQWHGRILEVRDGGEVVVAAGGQRRVVQVPGEHEAIEPGMLVRLRCDEQGVAQSIERMGGPQRGWDAHGDATRWGQACEPGSRAWLLWRRQDVVRALREDLQQHGFLEVDTPLLVPSTCPDAVMQSIETTNGRYLIPSSEYQLKRMMVGGFDRVYSLTKNFRAGDRGRLHAEEFTMLEWARCWQTLEEIEQDAERFVGKALQLVAAQAGQAIAWSAPWERIELRDALEAKLGVQVDEEFSLDSMRRGAAGLGLPDDFRDSPHLVLSWLLDALQPHLGAPVPTFLRGWPAFLTSSAERDPLRPNLALRSELYVAGIELADGFAFLRDAAQQRETFARENGRRERPVRVDDRYVAALGQGIPPGAGMALGVDRLVMALTGAAEIGMVLAFGDGEL